MKVSIILFALCLSAAISKAQETEKKILLHESPPFRETFYVLKNHHDVKQGPYLRQRKDLRLKGFYENDQRAGIWEAYGNDGVLDQKYDFDKNEMIFCTPAKGEAKYWIRNGDTFEEIKPDAAPAFIGGNSWLNYYVFSQIRYPASARENNIQGNVIISAVVTTDGKIIDEKIERGLGNGTDEEALRVILLIPDEWIPGMYKGEKTDMKILIPVRFRLM
jgi:protein TonB